jgi:hypothetical protein
MITIMKAAKMEHLTQEAIKKRSKLDTELQIPSTLRWSQNKIKKTKTLQNKINKYDF